MGSCGVDKARYSVARYKKSGDCYSDECEEIVFPASKKRVSINTRTILARFLWVVLVSFVL